MIEINKEQKEIMEEKFTKYEIARILGARALQIAMNAPVLLKLGKDGMEKLNYDPFKIAELEFYAGVLPISVKRPLPRKHKEKIFPKIKKEEKPEEKAEKKAEEERLEASETSEAEKAEKEKEEIMLEITKEVPEEIIELATPSDEESEEISEKEEREEGE